MFSRINLSSVFVLDQDDALAFYVDKLGLEVDTDQDLGFMRWLTVRVPGDPTRQLLLERPGPPAMDEATAAQVRELVTKGATAGWFGLVTDDVRTDLRDTQGARRRADGGADRAALRHGLRPAGPLRQRDPDRAVHRLTVRSATGNVTVKQAPPSGAGAAATVAPMRTTSPCTSASPTPPDPTGRRPR